MSSSRYRRYRDGIGTTEEPPEPVSRYPSLEGIPIPTGRVRLRRYCVEVLQTDPADRRLGTRLLRYKIVVV